MSGDNGGTTAGVRIDLWLWAARFYKLRRLASEAVKGGHVEINGVNAKPARSVHIGDTIHITRQQQSFEIIVRGLSARRGPAPVARTLYEETAESIKRREELAEQSKLQAASSPAPDRRPDKRARRHIIRFQSK